MHGNAKRIRAFLEEIATSDDWEYGNGEPMAEDARAFLDVYEEALAACQITRERLIGLASLPPAERERAFGHQWMKINDALRPVVVKAREVNDD